MHRRIRDFIVLWGRNCWRDATSCRECDHEVKLLDDVCPHCGAAHPGRIRATAIAVISLPIVLLLIYAFV